MTSIIHSLLSSNYRTQKFISFCRYFNELKCLFNISHDNVVQVFGWAIVENVFGFVMECMYCGSLSSLLSQNVSVAPLLRYRMCYDIACGIAHLHNFNDGKGIVHGNIKSENILLSGTLNCKVAGFGEMAHFPDDTTQFHPICAFDFYTPPEALQSPYEKKQHDYDVYSFSVVASEVLGWERPHPNYISRWLKFIKEGNAHNLYKIHLVEQVFDSDNENAKMIVSKLINVIEGCRKQERDRPTMVDVTKYLEEFWKKSDTSQIENDINEVLQEMSPAINTSQRPNLLSLNDVVSSYVPHQVSQTGTQLSVKAVFLS